MSAAPACVWRLGAVLGEGPVWSAEEQAIYFVDIKKPSLNRYALSGERTSWDMPERIGWAIPRASKPGFIAGFKSGFAELTLEPFSIRPFAAPEADRPNNRRNDAKVDRWGRIWAGSMDDNEEQPSGAFYRIDADLSWKRMDDGYRVANGPTFSPDHRVVYHTDSAARVIYQFDLAEDGTLANKRDFVRFVDDDWGYPDGMTTDAEGGVWVAHWDGARISRFTPDGKLDRIIAMPVSRPTSCAFAGDDLRRMFVTSASIGLKDEPLAGGLFEVDPGVRGAPQYKFAG